MKSLHKLVAVAFLCLLTASTGYAQEDAKDGKTIPVQQESKPVSQDEWHVLRDSLYVSTFGRSPA